MDTSTSTQTNLSNTTIHEDQLFSRCTENDRMSIRVMPEFIWVVSVLGIALNILVLLVFCLHKKPCTVPEIYLSNLVTTDLLLMFTLPFWAVAIANKYNWTFSNHVCRLLNLIFSLSFNCSIYFLVLISIDRFFALVHPLSQDRIHTRKCAKLVCLLVWCVCGLVGFPSLLCREIKIVPPMNISNYVFVCSVTAYNTLECIEITFGFVIPGFIIFYCSLKVIRALKKKRIEGVNAQHQMKRKATVLTLVVLLAFVTFWVPFYLTRLLIMLISPGLILGNDFCEPVSLVLICMHVVTFLACFKLSVLNPILYVIVGNNFRSKMRDTFRRLISTLWVTNTTPSR